MPIATPLYTVHAYKAESAYGTIPASSAAQVLRRTTLEMDLEKEIYESNEQRPDFQRADVRHGVRKVMGKLTGELSNGTYADMFAAGLKRDWTVVADITGMTLTFVNGGNGVWNITRAAGDFLAGGIKVGHIFYLTGGTANNLNKRMVVINVSATVINAVVLNGAALTAETAVAGYTLKTPGKVNFIPTSGHLAKSFAFEKWFSDLGQSEVYSGVRPTKISVKLPPTGLATIEVELMGRDMTPAAAQYFTSPTAALSTGIMNSVNGAARVAGQVVSNVTSLEFSISSPWSAEPVVGTNLLPETVPDTVVVSGSMTVNFDTVTQRDNFLNETTYELLFVVTADNTDSAAALTFFMPKVKATSFKKSDEGGKAVSVTVNFQALYQGAGGSGTKWEQTTIWMHDSTLV